MEYITVLSRIFEEDLRLLENEILETPKHIECLEKLSKKLYTFYEFNIKVEKDGECLIINHKEIPFLSHLQLSKNLVYISAENNQVTHLNQLKKLLIIQFGNAYAIDVINFHKKEDYFVLKTYVSVPFIDMKPIDICYYYYSKLMSDIYNEFTRDFIAQNYRTEFSMDSIHQKISKFQHLAELYLNTISDKIQTLEDGAIVQQFKAQKSLNDIFIEIENGLSNLLKYMEKYCALYFDKEHIMPKRLRHVFYKSYQKDSKDLRDLIKAQNLPLALEIELVKPLFKIINCLDSKRCSYHHKTYYRQYLHVIRKLFIRNKPPSLEEIYGVLITINFNTERIGKILTDVCTDSLEQCENEYKKQVYLRKEITRISSIQLTTDISYKSEFPGLKEYLLVYLDRCLNHTIESLEAKEQFLSLQEVANKISGMDIQELPKRELNLSLKEFSLFTRLVIDADIIKIKDREKRTLFRFLSKTFTSKGAIDISEGSIKNEFYKAKEITLKNVEHKLLEMLANLRAIRNKESA